MHAYRDFSIPQVHNLMDIVPEQVDSLIQKILNKRINLMTQSAVVDEMSNFWGKVREKSHFFLATRLNICIFYARHLLKSLTFYIAFYIALLVILNPLVASR